MVHDQPAAPQPPFRPPPSYPAADADEPVKVFVIYVQHSTSSDAVLAWALELVARGFDVTMWDYDDDPLNFSEGMGYERTRVPIITVEYINADGHLEIIKDTNITTDIFSKYRKMFPDP